jgi:hypothetical protein
MTMSLLLASVVSAGSLLLAVAGGARGGSIDITTAESSGTINGALFQTVDEQPTGTGVIDPFLRIQMKGVESGYNTDVRPIEQDQKTDPNFTRPLRRSEFSPTQIDGIDYIQFFLDINEPGNSKKSTVSLDQLQLFQSSTGSVNNYALGESNLGLKVYDLDSNGDNSVLMGGRIEQGSGEGGVVINIPKNLLIYDQPYLVLYAQFGMSNGSAGGFEEFTAIKNTNSINIVTAPIPLPPAVWSALITFGLIGAFVGVRRVFGAAAVNA